MHKEIEEIKYNLKKHAEDDTENLANIIRRLENSEEERRKRHEEVMSILKPIAETYTSASTMGKWLMGLAVFISIVLGILFSIKSIFEK